MTDRTERHHRLLARERLLATLSHEIRTPLNGVLGMAGLLAETKLNAQPVKLEPAATDIDVLLQGVCELLSPRAYASGIEIAWATDGRLPRVLADDGRLRQILFNLAGNAVKMTETGGVLLHASAQSMGEDAVRLRLEVRDTGPGVPIEHQAGIFEEFV